MHAFITKTTGRNSLASISKSLPKSLLHISYSRFRWCICIQLLQLLQLLQGSRGSDWSNQRYSNWDNLWCSSWNSWQNQRNSQWNQQSFLRTLLRTLLVGRRLRHGLRYGSLRNQRCCLWLSVVGIPSRVRLLYSAQLLRRLLLVGWDIVLGVQIRIEVAF